MGSDVNEKFIPLCEPAIRGNEWRYVQKCLDSGWVSTAGSFVDRFQQEFARCVGTKHAIATVNGTAALHVALLVAGIQPDDEVVVSSLTFIAPANAVRYVSAWPIFIDAERTYWQMDVNKLTEFFERDCTWRDGVLINSATGRRVRAILPVHILGHPVDMDALVALARKYELVVIEDATESLGARYRDRKVGTLGDIACFSFNGNKLITAGGGGMIVTDNAEWAQRAAYLTTQAKDDPIEYVHNAIGYNYRLTNIQAALGVAQLEQIEDYIAAKRRVASAYDNAFKKIPGVTPHGEASWAWSVFWMYTVLIDECEFGVGSRDLLKLLAEQNIQARPLWQPLHLSNAHKHSWGRDCVVAEFLACNALSIPCSVGLTQDAQDRVIEAVALVAERRALLSV